MLISQTLYEAQVRLEDGTPAILLHAWMKDEDAEENQYLRYTLSHEKTGEKLGELIWGTNVGHAGSKDTDTMPPWLVVPSSEAKNKLAVEYAKLQAPVPTTHNVVTFAVYRRNGAMMGQFRSFLAKLDPGKPSIHGGLIDDKDFLNPESDSDAVALAESFPAPPEGFYDEHEIACIIAAIREVWEEFGIRITVADLAHIGNVYDPDTRRFNHVYRVTVPYEDALMATHNGNAEAIMAAILDCEGLGRFTRMFKPDLLRAMETGAITSISNRILKEFPQLMPPESPTT